MFHPAKDLLANARSSIKEFSSRSSIGERRSRTNRSHTTPSPEQEAAASSNRKSPPRHPLSWASRGTRDLTAKWVSSQSEKEFVLELGDLIKLQTANPAYTLKRLAAWEIQLRLNDAHRAHLLETAKMAVQVAHGEFNRASHAVRQRVSKGEGAAFDPAPTIQFADATDLQTFAGAARIGKAGRVRGLSQRLRRHSG